VTCAEDGRRFKLKRKIMALIASLLTINETKTVRMFGSIASLFMRVIEPVMIPIAGMKRRRGKSEKKVKGEKRRV
jgi:hypothetical protein